MKNLFTLILIIFVIPAFSQDIHFSQFFNTPMALNPALTGFMKQDYRVNAIYRNQWKQAGSTFSTLAFGADANLIPAKLKGDKIGVGLFVFNDQMGNEIITNNSAYLSGSYIKTLDRQKRHKVSVGLQFGVVQKRIDYSNLYFSNQIIDYNIDMTAPNGEPVVGNAFTYLNLNGGAFYKFRFRPGTDLHAGISFYNLNKPKENFVQQSLENSLNKLKNRSIINFGLRQKLIENLYVRPEVLLMLQTKARDFNLGGALEYAITGNPDLLLLQAGVWLRAADALILYGGVKYHNVLIGVSYDMTNSTLNDIKDSPEVNDNARIGAFEITLTYLGFLKRALPHDHTIPCKFF